MRSITALILRICNKIQPKKGNPFYFPGNDMLLSYQKYCCHRRISGRIWTPMIKWEKFCLEKLLILSGVVFEIFGADWNTQQYISQAVLAHEHRINWHQQRNLAVPTISQNFPSPKFCSSKESLVDIDSQDILHLLSWFTGLKNR